MGQESTRILQDVGQGDPRASGQLLPLVYDELRKLAAAKLAAERPDHTLQPTALVHEAFLRLSRSNNDGQWDNERHFFAAAAEAMRRILIDHARRKLGPKAGGNRQRLELTGQEAVVDEPVVDVLALDDALKKLTEHDERAAQLVKLRFFAGLTIEQAAKTLGISSTTAKQDWAYAKCWLRAEMLDA